VAVDDSDRDVDLCVGLWTVRGSLWRTFPRSCYYFLLTSLNFVAGHPIIYTDNPGTPVQMVGVVAIRTVYA